MLEGFRSSFEWASNLIEFRWSEEQFNQQLLEFLDRALRAMWDRHLERGVDLRTAASMVGMDRVATLLGLEVERFCSGDSARHVGR